MNGLSLAVDKRSLSKEYDKRSLSKEYLYLTGKNTENAITFYVRLLIQYVILNTQ